MAKTAKLSIRVSEEEMAQLQNQAKKMEMSLADYVRFKLLGGSVGIEVVRLFNQTLTFIDKLPSGTQFTLKDLFQMFDSWDKIPFTLRLLLGKHFNKEVDQHLNNIIQKTEFKISNSKVYKKV